MRVRGTCWRLHLQPPAATRPRCPVRSRNWNFHPLVRMPLSRPSESRTRVAAALAASKAAALAGTLVKPPTHAVANSIMTHAAATTLRPFSGRNGTVADRHTEAIAAAVETAYPARLLETLWQIGPRMSRLVCKHPGPPGSRVLVAATRLAAVRPRDLHTAASQARAVELLAMLLQRMAMWRGMRTTVVLSAASASLGKQQGLLKQATQSSGFVAAARRLILAAVDTAGTCHSRHVSQLAVSQQRFGLFCTPFWERLSRQGCAELNTQAAANVLHAYATLHQAKLLHRVDKRLCKQLASVVAAADANPTPQNVSNTLWALATLGVLGDAHTLAALCAAAARLAAHMTPQGVSNTLWALGSLEAAVVADTLAALCATAAQQAEQMTPQGVSNTLLGLAKLGRPVSDAVKCELLRAVERIAAKAGGMNAQEVANTLWALSKLRWDGAAAVASPLAAAAERVSCDMNSQNTTNSLLALATLRWPLASALRVGLSRQVHRCLASMNEQAVANTLWAQAWFMVSRGEALNVDSSALFARAAELQGILQTEGMRQVRSRVCLGVGRQACWSTCWLKDVTRTSSVFGARCHAKGPSETGARTAGRTIVADQRSVCERARHPRCAHQLFSNAWPQRGSCVPWTDCVPSSHMRAGARCPPHTSPIRRADRCDSAPVRRLPSWRVRAWCTRTSICRRKGGSASRASVDAQL